MNSEGEDQIIMRDEFEKALNELKDRKAPGIDEIPAEFIKNSGENVKDMLYEPVYGIYETENTPRFYKIHNSANTKKGNSK